MSWECRSYLFYVFRGVLGYLGVGVLFGEEFIGLVLFSSFWGCLGGLVF